MSFAYLRLYTGDYLKKTRHLTPLKHGIYLLLLIHCWDTKGPLSLDEQEVAGIANCRSADEVEALRYVLDRYFVRMDDGWYNERMQDEIVAAEHYSEFSSRGGRRSAEIRQAKIRTRKQNEGPLKGRLTPLEGASQASASASTSTTTSKSNPLVTASRRPASVKSDDAGFVRFWQAYPRKQAKQAALKAYRRLDPDESALQGILAGIARAQTTEQWQRGIVPHAATFLNGERWTDEEVVAAKQKTLQELIAEDPRYAEELRNASK